MFKASFSNWSGFDEDDGKLLVAFLGGFSPLSTLYFEQVWNPIQMRLNGFRYIRVNGKKGRFVFILIFEVESDFSYVTRSFGDYVCIYD